MPRKSKPKPAGSKPPQAKSKLAQPPPKPKERTTSSLPSANKRRKITYHNAESTPANPVSAQAPSSLQEASKPALFTENANVDMNIDTNSNAKQPKTRAPPPQPPPSVPSTFVLLPPEADDPAIRSKWDIHTISLGGAGAKIESRVRQVLAILRPSSSTSQDNAEDQDRSVDSAKEPADEGVLREDDTEKIGKKGVLVALTARSVAGNKCISVAEIVKRDILSQKGVKGVWQYTGCWTRLETYKPPASKESSKNGKQDSDGGGQNGMAGTAKVTEHDVEQAQVEVEEDEEEAFETMQLPERKKVRNTVCMVIYLSLEPVARLKELYGEQVFKAKE